MRPVKKFTLSRRTMLRGIAGGALASVALPSLEAMLNGNGDALANGSPLPMRFGTFLFGNGVMLDRWVPAATGAGYTLTPQLAPLAAVKEHCTVLTGFKNKIPQITHHEGMAGMFSGHPYVQTGGLESHFGGPSIDQRVADAISAGTPLRSLELGVTKRISTNEGPTMEFLSHRDVDGTIVPQPADRNPVSVFNKLFGAGLPTDPSRALRVSVLDAVKADAARLKQKLGATDRQRLDAHLTSIEGLQNQINSVVVCNQPAPPTNTNGDVDNKEQMPAVAQIMTDLLAIAFSCDITRVASMMLTGGVGFTVYSHLGHNDEQHFMSHMPETYPEQLHATIVWNVQQFANLVTKLRDTLDANGETVLSSSLLVMGSDCSEGWTHGTFDQPVVLAGRARGKILTGFHYRAPAGSQRNLSDVLLSCVKAFDPAVTEIGAAEGYSNTPLTEILA